MRRIELCGAAVMAVALAFSMGAAAITPARATLMTFTNSAAFSAAASGIPLTVENYSTGIAGQTIASGGTFHGLSYTFTAGPVGTLLGGIITNQFNSLSGLSLGGNQSGGQQFFFGGDSFTVTFPTPINAIGAFFNVNLNSGNFVLATAGGEVVAQTIQLGIDYDPAPPFGPATRIGRPRPRRRRSQADTARCGICFARA